jgi:hypothetical protein
MTAESACPKCQQPRRAGAVACARCGLVFANWTPEQAEAVVRLDERGEALWAAVRESWREEERHDAFLKYCSLAGLLAPAGRCYRERLAADPQDALAARMQQRILTMATASFTHPAAPPRPVTRSVWFWTLLVGCALVGLLGALIFRR